MFYPDIHINNIGTIDYEGAMDLQEQEKQMVLRGQSRGTVFILEHSPPVITLGRRSAAGSLRFSEPVLSDRGYRVYHSGRAGDVTVHEPGQMVLYFVLPVPSKNSSAFVQGLARMVISFLTEMYGIQPGFDPARPGLWVGGDKLCSMGFDLTGGVSTHGIALNVSNTMEGFSLIVPCGMADIKMTNLSQVLGRSIDMSRIMDAMTGFMRKEFNGIMFNKY